MFQEDMSATSDYVKYNLRGVSFLIYDCVVCVRGVKNTPDGTNPPDSHDHFEPLRVDGDD